VVDRDQVMTREQGVEFPPKEEVDPTEQDRRHEWEGSEVANGSQEGHLQTGLELIRAGRYFDAHEELELAWRAADAEERDFFQGLVHVAVAWYQAGRGRRIGFERQLAKAARRLGPYAPEHRGVDVASVLAQVEAAREAEELEPVRL
jgi:predicted metal-dependent hydrolase